MNLRRTAMLAALAARLSWSLLRHPPPRRVSLAERLANLPLRGAPVVSPVTVRWNDNQIPWLEAERDADLAVGLGVVHAHLRLAQMEVLRHIAHGRTAELVGGIALPLDRSLRVLDLARAVPSILDAMPTATRAWLDGFVAGINHVVDKARLMPPEFPLLGLDRAPWHATDVLAIGRLASWDVSWLAMVAGLRLAGHPDFAALWRAMGDAGRAADPLDAVLGATGHGSNAFAVAGTRAAGNAFLASDPHLGLHVPGLWIVAGMTSPGHNAVGLMLPALPFVAIGRNRWIAWGGTNLHALSSELIDVTDEPASSFAPRAAIIRVRWGRPETITVRETAFGPVLNDAPLIAIPTGRTLALRWVGHRPSDELGAMLALNRARDWVTFRAALEGFAVPGQTFVYADAAGRVGRAIAAHLPRRKPEASMNLATPAREADYWDAFATARDLPQSIDPPDGIVVSANEPPPRSEILIGLFFSPTTRAERLRELLDVATALTAADLARIQRDDLMASSRELKSALLAAIGDPAGLGKTERSLVARLAAWDGSYPVESTGAPAFEILLARFARGFLDEVRLAAYRSGWRFRQRLLADMREAPPGIVAGTILRALPDAARRAARTPTWGAMHRLRLAHPLSRLPLVGRRWAMADLPSPGSDETVAKAAHGLVEARHSVNYGANARWISDLADADANEVVLLGGQDGWLGSDTLLDQVALWRSGRLVRIPLRPETAATSFPHVTVLTPPDQGLRRCST
ncbi:MAG: penicillin acylase family protein [Alphaproteobacteria bacterium]